MADVMTGRKNLNPEHFMDALVRMQKEMQCPRFEAEATGE